MKRRHKFLLQGKQVFYVTNSSTHTQEHLVKKLTAFGFPAQKAEVLCTSQIAARYLHNAKFSDKVYLVGKEEAMGAELDKVGIEYTGTGPELLIGETTADWKENINLDPKVKCVLVGFDPYFNYMKLMRAACYLKNPSCLFLVTSEESTYPVRDRSFCLPVTGCISKSLSVASGREPVVLGKPSPVMFEVLQTMFDLEPARCLMVGDRLDTDIMFARRCGMQSLLVLSGISTIDHIKQPSEKSGTENAQPDFYADNLASLTRIPVGCLGHFIAHRTDTNRGVEPVRKLIAASRAKSPTSAPPTASDDREKAS
ncbi:phosphoglycolate phosphatase [Plakobranchus ocellatus]|uniref:Phosphoglycolate phosphatase n=1 Tax=Plakobranchus ocellatus TaxID=259542 RepID=A0AAV4CED3_9GAST|nr:phosphoglycolate phosphatase [Plakobranchus ocellatus]